MYDYPPILKGEPVRDLIALRDYLVRKERVKEKEIREVSVKELQTELREKNSSLRKAVQEISQLDQQTASALRGLIIKTADTVEHNMDEIRTVLHEYYYAESDYGTYYASIAEDILQTARQTVESYEYQEQITAANADIGELQSAMTELNGQICRGVLTDPITQEQVLGIAISQQLNKGTATVTDQGLVYYDVSGTQTLGMYTSTGWQFWINGAKVGWFDSTDGMLHVGNILVENALQLGSDWLITTTGGFGIKYIGSTP